MKFLKWEDEFIRHTGLMVIGVGLFNLFNFLYHFFMIRKLSPIDYSHLNTLMALFMIISVPATTVQATVTKFVSSFYAKNQYDQIRSLLSHLFFIISIGGLIIFLFILLGSDYLGEFLRIYSRGLVILLGLLIFLGMVIPVPWGGLQGLEKFGSLTFNLIINGIIKLLLGFLFILIGLGVSGAISAVIISYGVTVFLSFLMLRKILLKIGITNYNYKFVTRLNPLHFSEIYKYFSPTGITILCFMVLTNVDLILVKHFFKPIEAGYYSIAQMVGKIILFLPVPIIMVMFPKISKLEGEKRKSLFILRRSLGINLLFCFIAILLIYLFPSIILRTIIGKVYQECIPLIRFFSLNMTLFSILLILLYYNLATLGRGFLNPLFLLTVIQIVAIIFFHQTLIHVLLIVNLVATCLLIINFYFIYHKEIKWKIKRNQIIP